MFRSIESKIRLNAILVYLIVAAICISMILYVYGLRNSIDDQRTNIELYNVEIAQVDSLIHLVYLTQEEANQYVSTKRRRHLTQFRENLNHIEYFIDSIQQINGSRQKEIFIEINGLLKEKGRIISELNRQFDTRDLMEPLNEHLLTIEPPVIKSDSIVITTVTQDTVINIPTEPKRNFFQRLSKVFSAEKPQDTIYTISTSVTDSIKIIRTDSLPPIIEEINVYTEQVRQDYIGRIGAIQNQVNRLMLADQEISIKLSGLLTNLYKTIVDSRMEELNESEDIIRKNNTYSLIGGLIALILSFIFILLIFYGVSKGLKARKALEKANEQIRQTMESRHKLLLSVSHDIKTPLNSILGYLELSDDKKELSGKDISSMKNSGKHILSLLENLLEFSALEQGALQASPQLFNLNELCSEIKEMFEPLARQKNLAFIYSPEFDPNLHLNGDSLKIKQIIINILSNSVKYTVEGLITFHITYQDNKLQVDITDTGVGIPKEQLHILFRPFTRIDSNNSLAEGTGFGMYVVKGLTELLQGEITVFSEVNEGTKTHITIPAQEIPVKDMVTPRKLLLIDDDLSFLTMLKDMFVRLGHQVEICKSMQDFEIYRLRISTFDIVLTDMEMGPISGKDILKRIREADSNIPIILMSARSDFSHEKVLSLGFSNYLRKPVTTSSLKSLLAGEIPGNTPDTNDFQLLEEMFENDKEMIREVLETFVNSTQGNIQALQDTLEKDNFAGAQSLCHKMLPMFMQIDAGETVNILKKMDALRDEKAEDHPYWKEDIKNLLSETDKLLDKIRQCYQV